MINPVKMEAEVIRIVEHAEDVFTVTMQTIKKIPSYAPGQFLQLALDDYDASTGFWPESRAFSIASTSDQNLITISYSVKGYFTGRMRDELRVGKKVWLRLPLGMFIIDDAGGTKDILLIAGGTGVAPFIAYLESRLTQPSSSNIVLAYGIRGAQYLLFKDALRLCCEKLANLSVIIFNEANDFQPKSSHEKIEYIDGRIDLDFIYKKSLLLQSSVIPATEPGSILSFNVFPDIYLAGPPGLIEAAQEYFRNKGMRDEKIKIDDWGYGKKKQQ